LEKFHSFDGKGGYSYRFLQLGRFFFGHWYAANATLHAFLITAQWSWTFVFSQDTTSMYGLEKKGKQVAQRQ
jgi:hypothetical protein